jgi:hypothetical protein
MMWQCPKCGTQIDEGFDLCWNCGTGQDGTPTLGFRAEPGDSAVPDLGPDPELPPVSEADIQAARVMRERIVELCSAANVVEADGLCEMLEEAGIQARVVGDDLGAAAGCLPLGEATAPRLWVHESDLDRAREVIDQWRRELEHEPIEPPESDGPPEWETAAESEEAAIPSDVRFRFLNQAFFIAGFACIVIGAVWAWKNSTTLSEYSATTEGRWVEVGLGGVEMVRSRHDRNLPLQPIVESQPSWKFSIRATYAYVVAGKIYNASMDFDEGATPLTRVAIHYNSQEPAKHVVGSIAPPWVVLLFAFGIAAFLSFVGYQFR